MRLVMTPTETAAHQRRVRQLLAEYRQPTLLELIEFGRPSQRRLAGLPDEAA